ncbi:hypothetical protein PBY51_024474 [Eleginops maclovinus]|uniref:Uncharacterized protein n=1 Tax=Eleginops maclovinus TaxID=56733 RepID=A0AAN8AW46_ELEMC|nr:hypothetical protein PBY51_024474 [Eleginops maclovinus]
MYSDLGSDWRKALRKTGGVNDDMLGVGVGQHGGAVRWFGYRADFESETHSAAELTDFTDASGLRERSCAPTDGSRLMWRMGKIHRAGISNVGKQQPCWPAGAFSEQGVDESGNQLWFCSPVLWSLN